MPNLPYTTRGARSHGWSPRTMSASRDGPPKPVRSLQPLTTISSSYISTFQLRVMVQPASDCMLLTSGLSLRVYGYVRRAWWECSSTGVDLRERNTAGDYAHRRDSYAGRLVLSQSGFFARWHGGWGRYQERLLILHQDELALIGASEGGKGRWLAVSDADRRARDLFVQWCKAANWRCTSTTRSLLPEGRVSCSSSSSWCTRCCRFRLSSRPWPW
jgi:hypothetical protein